MGGHLMHSGAGAPLSQSKGPGIDVAPLVFEYASGEGSVGVEVYESRDAVTAPLADRLVAASKVAIARKGSYTVALSGGSLPYSLAGLVDREDADFSKWIFLFADERNVPHDSEDSNLKLCRGAFLDALVSTRGLPEANILKLGLDAHGRPLPTDQAAEQYAGQILSLPTAFPEDADALPVVDDILLGIGPDGHTASLFPNFPQLAQSGIVLPIDNSPKPPPSRITLSLPVINAAARVLVVALGKGKTEIVERALEVQALPGALPCQLVRPKTGDLVWMLDADSAAALHIPDWALKGRKSPFPRSDMK